MTSRRLDARPAFLAGDLGRVVVAGHQMLAAGEPRQEVRHPGRCLPDRKIAEMPDLVFGADHRIPALDQGRIHGGDRGKRPAIEGQRAGMPEMCVAGEIDRHQMTRALDRGQSGIFWL